MVPGFVFCLVDSSRWLRAPHGKKLGTSIYGPQFRVLSGGSKWPLALPTGSKWLSARRLVEAAPT